MNGTAYAPPIRMIATNCQSRQERLQSQLSHKSFTDSKNVEVIRVQDIVQSQVLGNDDQIVLEVHDILKSYYELSLKRFVDNVRMQVADFFLVLGPDTPLKIFTPKFAAAMTDDQLEEIAAEDEGQKLRRVELENEMLRLERGRQILR